MKELGRVDNLLKVRDVTEIRTSGLSPEAQEEIRQVVEAQGTVHSIGNPTTTLEELFVRVIEESEAHPGPPRPRGPERRPAVCLRGTARGVRRTWSGDRPVGGVSPAMPI